MNLSLESYSLQWHRKIKYKISQRICVQIHCEIRYRKHIIAQILDCIGLYWTVLYCTILIYKRDMMLIHVCSSVKMMQSIPNRMAIKSIQSSRCHGLYIQYSMIEYSTRTICFPLRRPNSQLLSPSWYTVCICKLFPTVKVECLSSKWPTNNFSVAVLDIRIDMNCI